MKKYCFDTSGLSNPLETMPEDIHESLWRQIRERIEGGMIAVTAEIYEEMTHIPGITGDCIRGNEPALVLEVGEEEWDWHAYVNETTRMQDDYRQYISDFNGGSKGTVCLKDISIIALAKTLRLPVVSMESLVRDHNSSKRRIPNICNMDGVVHKTFSEFCRLENLKA